MLLLVRCERVEDISSEASLKPLTHRCVELREAVRLVALHERGDVVDSVLAPANGQSDAQTGATLAVGDQIIIDRFLLRKSSNGQELIIVGHPIHPLINRKVSLFYLFSTDWMFSMSHVGVQLPEEIRPRATAPLEGQRAQWCR